jgi:flagellar biosynthesis protein FlhF
MNVKKFIAATSREALLLVRNELGEEAVILSNRKVDEGVEIAALSSADYAKLTEPRKTPSRPVLKPAPVRRESVASGYGKYSSPDDEILSPFYSDEATDFLPSDRLVEASATYTRDSHDYVQAHTGSKLPAKLPLRNEAPEKILAGHTDEWGMDSLRAAQVNKPVVAEAIISPTPAAMPVPGIISEQQGILSEIKSMRNMMQEQIACLSWSDMQHRDPQRAQMLRSMLNAGFSPALSRQLLEKMPAEADISWVRQVLGNNLRVATQEEDVVVRGGVYALIGPTGVGKTTTTAKLAARAVVRYGADKVALLTTDSYRVGAHEQLRVYSKILGVELHAVRDTEDLRLTLSALKRKHLVLVDTMGLGQRDSRVAEQTEMFNAAGVQRLLLLNATSGGDTLEDVVHKYHGAGVIGCIPTKLDEAGTLGTVLDVALRHKLALHYITSGQRVPEDLHEVNLEYLLHRTFKPAAKAAPFTLRELDFPALMAGLGAATGAREAYAI